MGLDIFAIYLGNYLYGEVTSKYTSLMKSKATLTFQTLNSGTVNGIHYFCLPFIQKDPEGKKLFMGVYKKAIKFLPKVKPRVRRNFMAEKISKSINNLLELYIAVSCEEENHICQLLDELLEDAPEIMEFASEQLINVFRKKMANLEKTLKKESASAHSESLNFYEIDHQILNTIAPYFREAQKLENLNVQELVKDSQCLISTKEREIYNRNSDCLPDVFMRLCPIDLVRTFSDEYRNDVDDNISVYSGLTMETEMTLEQKEEKSSKIL